MSDLLLEQLKKHLEETPIDPKAPDVPKWVKHGIESELIKLGL